MESGRSDCFVAGRRRCSLAGWRPGHSTRHGRPQGHASARISHLRYHLVRTTTYSPPLLLVWLPLSRTHVLRKATTGQSHIAPTNGPWGLITMGAHHSRNHIVSPLEPPQHGAVSALHREARCHSNPALSRTFCSVCRAATTSGYRLGSRCSSCMRSASCACRRWQSASWVRRRGRAASCGTS